MTTEKSTANPADREVALARSRPGPAEFNRADPAYTTSCQGYNYFRSNIRDRRRVCVYVESVSVVDMRGVINTVFVRRIKDAEARASRGKPASTARARKKQRQRAFAQREPNRFLVPFSLLLVYFLGTFPFFFPS